MTGASKCQPLLLAVPDSAFSSRICFRKNFSNSKRSSGSLTLVSNPSTCCFSPSSNCTMRHASGGSVGACTHLATLEINVFYRCLAKFGVQASKDFRFHQLQLLHPGRLVNIDLEHTFSNSCRAGSCGNLGANSFFPDNQGAILVYPIVERSPPDACQRHRRPAVG